jgi:23S rRNA pseudouridine955/2504/2580 synthase
VPGAEFKIVHEDSHLLVIDKPAGVAVHGGSGVSYGVIEQLRAARPDAKFLELVHRLDRETSGLLLLAKKRSALTNLHEQMRDGTTDKRYLTLVAGDWTNKRQHVKLPLHKFTTRTASAASWCRRAARKRTRVQPAAQMAGVRPARSRAQDRAHAPDPRAPGFVAASRSLGDEKYGDFALNKQLQKADDTRGALRACSCTPTGSPSPTRNRQADDPEGAAAGGVRAFLGKLGQATN